MLNREHPRRLREYARTLLDLADAYEDGKVSETRDPYVQHTYARPIKFDRLLDARTQIMPESAQRVLCGHDLAAHAFYLVFAQCRVSGTFFINPHLTQLLSDRFHHLSSK